MSDLLTPGQILAGRYRVERFLAEGGFGAVYVAEQIETELKVAVKVLWPHILRSADAIERFQLEARVAGRVGGDHIVKVFDAGVDNELRAPFLVMELLQGEELEKLASRRGQLPPDFVIAVLRQVASALDKAHRYVDREGQLRPIIHRDLKPDNIFVTQRETGEPLIKILDFGIAKVLSESTSITDQIRGTLLYMASEQAEATRVSPQTDIWPLGLIAFYLLTGTSYWKTPRLPGATPMHVLTEILVTPLAPASERAVELGAVFSLPPAFDLWFSRCVNRDASARFSSAGECVAQLALALAPAPAAVAPTQPFEPRTQPRPTQDDGAAPPAATPFARVSAAATPPAAASFTPPPAEAAQSTRSRKVVLGVAAIIGVALLVYDLAPRGTTRIEQPPSSAPAPSRALAEQPTPTPPTEHKPAPASSPKRTETTPPGAPATSEASVATLGPDLVESAQPGTSEFLGISGDSLVLKFNWEFTGPSIGLLSRTGGTLQSLQPAWEYPFTVTLEEDTLYWIERDGPIKSCPLRGGGVKVLGTTVASVTDMVVAYGVLYWADRAGGKLLSVPAKGGDITTLVTGQSSPSGLAAGMDALYWVTPDRVWNYGFDGGGASAFAKTRNPRQIYQDIFSLVWTTDSAIQRSDPVMFPAPDHKDVVDIASNQQQPSSVQMFHPMLYWINSGEIMRVSQEDGAPPIVFVKGEDARSLLVDEKSLYWISAKHHAVRKRTPR